MTSPYLIAVNDVPDALDKLADATGALQKADAKRLLGDKATLTGAVLALLLVLGRIEQVEDEAFTAELEGVAVQMAAAE